jgi:hypothetical protein
MIAHCRARVWGEEVRAESMQSSRCLRAPCRVHLLVLLGGTVKPGARTPDHELGQARRRPSICLPAKTATHNSCSLRSESNLRHRSSKNWNDGADSTATSTTASVSQRGRASATMLAALGLNSMQKSNPSNLLWTSVSRGFVAAARQGTNRMAKPIQDSNMPKAIGGFGLYSTNLPHNYFATNLELI